jgi:ABC-type glycerol-3-phosphate transport system substrate-binding protein
MSISECPSRRLNLPLLTIVISVLALSAACRAAPPVPPQPQPVSGTPATGPITLILWHSETGASRSELETLARDFHTAYPNLIVTPQYVGTEDDLTKQVTAAVALGKTPDLVLANGRDIAQFVRQQGLLALDKFRADPSVGLSVDDVADFLPGILGGGAWPEFHNKLYAFPFDAAAMVLFYNADMLKAAEYPNPPASWDEFADMAGKMTTDKQYGWAMQMDADVFSGMLVSRGSAMLDDPERRTLFAERGGVASMTLASELVKSGAAAPESDEEGALTDFAGGHAAFYFDWMTKLSAIQNAQKRAGADFEIGVSNLPQGDPTDSFVFERSYDFGIFKTSPDRERNAWFFVRWITASHQTAQWARAVGAIPLRSSALPFLAGAEMADSRLQQIEASFGGTVPQIVPQSANRHAAEIERLMAEAWTQVALSKADAASTLTAASAKADSLLGANP